MSFAALGLNEPIVRAISERGYTTPTPIQAQAIPAVLSGGDLLAGAQTGTGKTAGFTLPILQRLSSSAAKRPGAIRALILTPTRELAAQIEESVRHYGKHLDLKSMVMFGGVSINPQIAQLKRRTDILVATPGRLLDHAQQKTVDLSQIEILVLDEADRMLDMGFIHDIKKVLALLPKQRQNLLFSATFSDEIKTLADRLLNNPALIEVARRNQTTELVEQKVMLVEQKAKRHVLAHLIKTHDWHQVLVFTRTKHGANRLAEQLTKGGISALAIHGNKSQNARTRALSEFKAGTLQVLVATDIAARGLDISELPHVVNFELPNVPEDYVHRIGRTGRAGASGEALSLVDGEEKSYLADIEKLIKKSINRVALPADFVMPAPSADDSMARPPRQPRQPPRKERGEGEQRRQREAQPQRQRPQGERKQQPSPQANSGTQSNPGNRRGSRPEGNGQRSGQGERGGERDGNRGNAQRPDDARGNSHTPRGDGQRRPRSQGNGGGSSFSNAPRHGQGGNGNRQRQAKTPRYPRDENGDVNGNVVLPEAPEVDGNRAGGLRGAISRGINALRKLG